MLLSFVKEVKYSCNTFPILRTLVCVCVCNSLVLPTDQKHQSLLFKFSFLCCHEKWCLHAIYPNGCQFNSKFAPHGAAFWTRICNKVKRFARHCGLKMKTCAWTFFLINIATGWTSYLFSQINSPEAGCLYGAKNPYMANNWDEFFWIKMSRVFEKKFNSL